MKQQYLITGLLAAVFCITGHFFMKAYTDYSINQSRLALLEGQVRSVNHQIKMYQEKLNQLEQVNTFMDKADQLGLNKDLWDVFFVDLKEEPFSYPALENLLNQTQSSARFYFMPNTLSIRTGAQDTDPVLMDGKTDKTSQSGKAGPWVNPDKKRQIQTDITLNLDGYFLVRRQGAQ